MTLVITVTLINARAGAVKNETTNFNQHIAGSMAMKKVLPKKSTETAISPHIWMSFKW